MQLPVPFRPPTARLRRRAPRRRGRAIHAGRLAAAPARAPRQLGAAPGSRSRRSAGRWRRRSHASDAAPRALSLPETGSCSAGRPARPHPADEARRPRGGDQARRHQLLLAAARARACAGRHVSGSGIPLWRRVHAHGRGRVLDLRHVAHAQRAQSHALRTHTPGRRHRRERSVLANDGGQSGGSGGALRSGRPALPSLRGGEPARGHDTLGDRQPVVELAGRRLRGAGRSCSHRRVERCGPADIPRMAQLVGGACRPAHRLVVLRKVVGAAAGRRRPIRRPRAAAQRHGRRPDARAVAAARHAHAGIGGRRPGRRTRSGTHSRPGPGNQRHDVRCDARRGHASSRSLRPSGDHPGRADGREARCCSRRWRQARTW